MSKRQKHENLSVIIAKVRSIDCEDWDDLIAAAELLDAVASVLVRNQVIAIRREETPSLDWILAKMNTGGDQRMLAATQYAESLIRLAASNEYFGDFLSIDDVDTEDLQQGIDLLCDVLETLQGD